MLPQARPRYGQFSCLTLEDATETPAAVAPAPDGPFKSSAPAYEQLALSYITKMPLKKSYDIVQILQLVSRTLYQKLKIRLFAFYGLI